MKLGKAILALFFVVCVCLTSASTFAGEYPEKKINIYIPYSGGGSTDIAARMLANLAQESFSTPLVLSNRPGGGSAVMHELIAQAEPDGYTLGILVTAAITRLPLLREVNYDPFNDFTPIMLFALYQHGLAVPADSPWQTFEEFIAYAKANPGEVTYSTAGAGSGQHLVMEYIAGVEGIKWTHIPYKGGVEAVTAALGGHVTAVSQATEWAPYVKSGQLRLLAVYGVKRIEGFPDVRTLSEIGYDYALTSGMGLVGPKGLPEDVVTKLTDAFSKAYQEDSFQKTASKLEILPYYLGQEELNKFLAEAYERKKEIISRIGIGKK